ncbi:hypothetical protein AB1M95_06500 [Sulfitobacter sp. LCG007]
MSNIIEMKRPRRLSLQQRQARLIEIFSRDRRGHDDVFWLKENAELLNILSNGDSRPDRIDLEPYAALYRDLPQRLRFFPQYYRFLLSICLDLEDLGMRGGAGSEICDLVLMLDLPEMEISDLQRAEARRLLARRKQLTPDPALDDRLRAFISRPETFALPNRKAAYELTHIVFYLSDYGRIDPQLGAQAATSLEFAGLLAFLDQDADLLAEVCIAMRLSGQQPSGIWEDWLAREIVGFDLGCTSADALRDDYHEYLVVNWWAGQAGLAPFRDQMPRGSNSFVRRARKTGPLRAMSELMFRLGEARSRDWQAMRPAIENALCEEGCGILLGAERSSDHFDDFFEGFARA